MSRTTPTPAITARKSSCAFFSSRRRHTRYWRDWSSDVCSSDRRRASASPFLCLIDDHLLCPDKACLLHELEKRLVNARVVRQLGVERGDEEAAVPEEHGIAVELGEHLDARTRVGDPRRADENSAEWLGAVRELHVRLEAPDLPAVRVSLDGEVDEAEVVTVEQDHPGARPEDGRGEAANRLLEPVEPGEPADRRRLPAGEDKAVQPVEVAGPPHLHDVCPETFEHPRVLADVPLDGENADHGFPRHAQIVSAAKSKARARTNPACLRLKEME